MPPTDRLEALASNLFCFVAFLAVSGGLVFSIDDLWIDLCALIFRLRPVKLTNVDLEVLRTLPQKRIALLIANWKEFEILERMIVGNLERIDYLNYSVFIGVYPNDLLTWKVAAGLEKKFANISVVVNSRPGPTTKGQMLNEITRSIFAHEARTGIRHDLLLMQDSEDVLHPLALQLINQAADEADFIQTPVFSFNVPLLSLTRGVYLEEFSESHTKDLLVRQHMGAAVPSAGVGTALTHRLVSLYMKYGSGQLLREDTLTEDYDLGLKTRQFGLKSQFVCAYRSTPDGRRDFIATREYFPGRVRAAIRQKTRWTLGIAFQGLSNLGWRGSDVDRYFLFRDRRGPINGVLIVLDWITVLGFAAGEWGWVTLPPVLHGEPFVFLAAGNAVAMLIRVVQRGRAVYLVHQSLGHVLMVLVRWPVGTWINSVAAFMAFRAHRKARRTGHAPKWDKTAHEIPKSFGQLLRPAALKGLANVGFLDRLAHLERAEPIPPSELGFLTSDGANSLLEDSQRQMERLDL